MDRQAQEAVSLALKRATAEILLAHPWWATLLLHLRLVESDTVPTMGTNGTLLYYSPSFVADCSANHLRGVLLHEVAHIALQHPYRRAWRDPLKWNIAADAAANALLCADNITLPADAVPPGPLGATAEELYDSIQTTACDCRLFYDHDASDGKNTMTPRDWADVLGSAQGIAPAAIARVVAGIMAPKIDWRAALALYISSMRRDDRHTWMRPSRRLRHLPGWRPTPEMTIAVCIDTSGSITANQLEDFATECRAITALVGAMVYILAADATVHATVAPGEPFPSTFPGGGGTDFGPAIDAAVTLGVDGIVYLSDGDGAYPPAPGLPIMWALTRDRVIPYGRKIILEGRRG